MLKRSQIGPCCVLIEFSLILTMKSIINFGIHIQNLWLYIIIVTLHTQKVTIGCSCRTGKITKCTTSRTSHPFARIIFGLWWLKQMTSSTNINIVILDLSLHTHNETGVCRHTEFWRVHKRKEDTVYFYYLSPVLSINLA